MELVKVLVQGLFICYLYAKTKSLNKTFSIINNYSPKWRWVAVDIYRAAKRRGKYPTLASDTEVEHWIALMARAD